MTSVPAPRPRIRASHVDRGAQRRELYFFTLYRAFQAAILAFFVFSPTGLEVADLQIPWLARGVAVVFLLVAMALLVVAIRLPRLIARQAAVGLALDIACLLLARLALEGPDTGLSLLLIVNIGAGALLLPFRWGLGFAIAAGLGALLEFISSNWGIGGLRATAAEPAMFAISYLTTAVLCHSLGQQLRESLELAEQRGEQAANLAQVNELVIRRLQTGVLVVDAENRVRMLNEIAWNLLGEPPSQQRDLAVISPALCQRLREWRAEPDLEPSSLQLRPELPEVIPRITGLGSDVGLFLIFLEDSALVSRRAEQLTLSTLGRLSASIAHEIRNPLAAIHHAAQLLEESPDLPAQDRRLIEIVLSHCQRMNGIVGNVLALSRRERSRPEPLDIGDWTRRFVESFRAEHFVSADVLQLGRCQDLTRAIFDRQQLHQVISVLVNNALQHGHAPGEPARITVSAGPASDSGFPCIEVTDRGPGIPEDSISKVFDPFFTTSDLGSGLGLYIAHQLCEANQASLEYRRGQLGGSCFRLTLARPLGGDTGLGDWSAKSPSFAKLG